jgi:hypothetical protein
MFVRLKISNLFTNLSNLLTNNFIKLTLLAHVNEERINWLLRIKVMSSNSIEHDRKFQSYSTIYNCSHHLT